MELRWLIKDKNVDGTPLYVTEKVLQYRRDIHDGPCGMNGDWQDIPEVKEDE